MGLYGAIRKVRLIFLLMLIAGLVSTPLFSQGKRITIIHTNDLHSHFMGFSPELDYTPETTGDDATKGGWARVAAVIKKEKAARANPVLVLDAGDYTMGSLFHMRAREESFELRLMKTMGYDVVTLGNHEFDLMPDGLSRIIKSARRSGCPEIVFSNAVFSKESAEDDSLEKVFKGGLVKPYMVKNTGGLRIGFFGLLGHDAAEVAPFASPVTFRNYVEAAREMTDILRRKEKVDMVIFLSHSGLFHSIASEDEVLAREVPGIDVIVSGHTHTLLPEPIVIGSTIIVQAHEYGKRVGVLDIDWNDGKAKIAKYGQTVIDDSIPGDKTVQRAIDGFMESITRSVLRPHKLSYFQTIAETKFDLMIEQKESTLGNLITDAIRWYVNKYDSDPADPSTRVAFAVESNGLIRTHLFKGETGKVAVADVFRTIPLGIGMDGSMAYPLITFYVNGSEIKKAVEILTSIYPLKGSDYFLQISGLKFSYNPRRVLFDRVTQIWMENEKGEYVPLDYSSSNKNLYRVAANIYNATFLKVVGNFTYKILTIVPKDRKGNPVADLKTRRVDADKTRPGIQELKEWIGVMEYIKTFKDLNGNGIPDIPAAYENPQGRIVKKASFSPFSLLVRPAMPTWAALGALTGVIALLALAVMGVRRFLRKRST